MNRRIFTFLTVFIVLTVQSGALRLLRRQKRIIGGIQAAQPPEDDPVVFVNKNERDARIYGSRDPKKGFYVYRGIRFGKPPIGRNRFQRPRAVHLEGEFNATAWGPPCPQTNKDKIVGTEDCLFLNVFTPALPDTGDGYPVLIWIHGGGFRRGAACQYEMRNLIKKKMVVVSIQYRLGSLGFLSTGTKELPGNNGMFDMMLAVNWVKDYIQFFGGDPKKIIAFGHGTGASSAFMLSISKLAKNFFSGLIAMSGSILSHFAIDKDPMTTAKMIASHNGCPIDDIPEMIRCLQELPVERLVAVDSKFESIRMAAQGFLTGLSNLLGPGPVIEGENDQRSLPNFMTQTPESALKLGDFPSIPLLTGVTQDETGGAIFGRYKDEVQNKLKTVPNFLTDDLIRNLQGTVANFENKTKQLVPGIIDQYLKAFGNGNEDHSIEKVAKITGDALFNAPVFLTVDHWSKKANTFLYSFDHKIKRSYSKDFLEGLPIVDAKSSSTEITSHGDDLGYIFGRNSIFGEEIVDKDDQRNVEDERVMDVFTDMIANFAQKGELNIESTSKGDNKKWLTTIVPSFSGSSNPFVSITSAPQLMANFRFCEMGLWAGLTERLQSATCNLFQTAESISEGVGQAAKVPVAKVKNVVESFVPGIHIPINSPLIDSKQQQKSKVVGQKKEKELLPRFGQQISDLNLFG